MSSLGIDQRELQRELMKLRRSFPVWVNVLSDETGTRDIVWRSPKNPHNYSKSFYRLDNGVRVTCYKAIAPQEEHISMDITGYKADYILSPNRIKQDLDRHTSHYWISIPNPGMNAVDHTDIYAGAITKFLRGPTAEIREVLKKPVPKTIFAHSTGGRCLLDATFDPSFCDYIDQTFDGIILSSTYLDSAYSSKKFAPIRSAFWRKVCKTWPAEIPDNLPIAAQYLRFFGEDSTPAGDKGFIHPTLQQVDNLTEGSRQTVERIEKEGHPLQSSSVPLAFFYSTQDGFSCPKMNQYVAGLFNAASIAFVGKDHSSICHNDDAYRAYAAVSEAMGQGTFDPQLYTQVIDPRAKNGTSLAQRPAGFFNQVTGLAQSLLGGRVADAEMGAEAEGGPVHARHANPL